MNLKNKTNKTIGLTLAILTITGSCFSHVNAQEMINKYSTSTKISMDKDAALEDGTYKIKNVILGDYAAFARPTLEENSPMEVKDGKITINITVKDDSKMGAIKLDVDGKATDYVKTEISEHSYNMKFVIPSIDSKVTVNTKVVVSESMQFDTSYDLVFDKDTLEKIDTEKNQAPVITCNDFEIEEGKKFEYSMLGAKATDNEDGDLTKSIKFSGDVDTSKVGTYKVAVSVSDSKGETTTKEVSVVVVKKAGETIENGKLYTIKNEIVSDNEIGAHFAREGLDEISDVQMVGDKTYVTLKLLGVDDPSIYKIFVNGTQVKFKVEEKTSEALVLKFEVPDLDALVTVGTHLVLEEFDMDMYVEYGVKFLKNTLTFVKDFDAEEESDDDYIDSDTEDYEEDDDSEDEEDEDQDEDNEDQDEELEDDEEELSGNKDDSPKTGDMAMSNMLLAMGGILSASGALFGIKRRKK